MSADLKAVSKSVLLTIIIVVLGVCVTVGFIAYEFRPSTLTLTPSPEPTATSISPSPTFIGSPIKIQIVSNDLSVLNGESADITAYVTVEGTSISGAIVKFTSDNGGTFSAVRDMANGYYVATFTAPSFSKITNCTIRASAVLEWLTSQTSTRIAVGPSIITTAVETLQFQVKDEGGNILSGAVVSSTNQPNGTAPLYGITNSIGYVTFSNIQQGTYTFNVEKTGYQDLAETLDFKGGTLSLTLTLSNERITIQAVSYDSANRVLTIYAQSQSSVSPVLNSIIVKDASGNTVATLGIGTITPSTTGNALSKRILYTIQANVNPNGLSTGTFTATLTKIAGSSFVSPTFTVSSQMPYYN